MTYMKAQQSIFPIMTSKNHFSYQIHIRSTPSDSLTPGKNLPLVAIIPRLNLGGDMGRGLLERYGTKLVDGRLGFPWKLLLWKKMELARVFDGVNFPETDFFFSGFYDQQKGVYQYGDPCPFLCYFFFLKKKGFFHLSTDGVWYEPNSVPLYVEWKQSPLRVCVWIW